MAIVKIEECLGSTIDPQGEISHLPFIMLGYLLACKHPGGTSFETVYFMIGHVSCVYIIYHGLCTTPLVQPHNSIPHMQCGWVDMIWWFHAITSQTLDSCFLGYEWVFYTTIVWHVCILLVWRSPDPFPAILYCIQNGGWKWIWLRQASVLRRWSTDRGLGTFAS